MTLAEFKAWFDGFSETMDGPPNEKQWDRIKARVAEISNTPISYPIFVERYREPYRRWYDSPVIWGSAQNTGSVSKTELGASTVFNPIDELKRAGRAEYSAYATM